MRYDSRFALIVGKLTLCVYLVSFLLPAYGMSIFQSRVTFFGWQAFYGAGLFWALVPMWLANPALWFGLVKLFHGRWAAAGSAGLVATALALSEIWLVWDDLAFGYLVWVASMMLLMSGGWYGCWRERRGLARQERDATSEAICTLS
jgi:hypothetical protein